MPSSADESHTGDDESTVWVFDFRFDEINKSLFAPTFYRFYRRHVNNKVRVRGASWNHRVFRRREASGHYCHKEAYTV